MVVKFVPQLRTEDKKNYQVEVAQDKLESIRRKPGMFEQVITRAYSWVYGYDPEAKAQFSQRKITEFPRAKKAREQSEQHKGNAHFFL